jgi:aryl-alcohol dehydrogenase-like predicted oxidoreductase
MRLNALRQMFRSTPNSIRVDSAPRLTIEVVPARRINRAELQAAFDASRRSLGTDYIDLYLLHEELPSALEAAARDFLLELRASGRVGKLGLAANGSRYLGLTPADLVDWDVLQYEFGPAWPAHAGLPKQFPAKMHIFHSCLKGVAGEGNAPGYALAACLSANPYGRVLFSSTKLAHVRDNLRVLQA